MTEKKGPLPWLIPEAESGVVDLRLPLPAPGFLPRSLSRASMNQPGGRVFENWLYRPARNMSMLHKDHSAEAQAATPAQPCPLRLFRPCAFTVDELLAEALDTLEIRVFLYEKH